MKFSIKNSLSKYDHIRRKLHRKMGYYVEHFKAFNSYFALSIEP